MLFYLLKYNYVIFSVKLLLNSVELLIFWFKHIKLHMEARQVESTIPHLADPHFFVQIRSAVLKADSLPN